MLGAAMRYRLTEEHVHDASPLMHVCGFLACFVLRRLPSMTIPPTIKQITDCLECSVEPCGHLRERGQGAGLLFHQ
jgi:hypothetical protein